MPSSSTSRWKAGSCLTSTTTAVGQNRLPRHSFDTAALGKTACNRRPIPAWGAKYQVDSPKRGCSTRRGHRRTRSGRDDRRGCAGHRDGSRRRGPGPIHPRPPDPVRNGGGGGGRRLPGPRDAHPAVPTIAHPPGRCSSRKQTRLPSRCLSAAKRLHSRLHLVDRAPKGMIRAD
jgi:hypothetical protein